jgi:hypothetical protein
MKYSYPDGDLQVSNPKHRLWIKFGDYFEGGAEGAVATSILGVVSISLCGLLIYLSVSQ